MTMTSFILLDLLIILLTAGGGGFSFRGWLIAKQDYRDAQALGTDESSLSAAQWRIQREAGRFIKQVMLLAGGIVSLAWRIQYPSAPTAYPVYFTLRMVILGVSLMLVRDTIIDRMKRREIALKYNAERRRAGRRMTDPPLGHVPPVVESIAQTHNRESDDSMIVNGNLRGETE